MSADDYFAELSQRLDGLFDTFVDRLDKSEQFGLAKDFLTFSVANAPSAHVALKKLLENAKQDGEILNISSEGVRQILLEELLEMRKDISLTRDELAGILATLSKISSHIENQELSVSNE